MDKLGHKRLGQFLTRCVIPVPSTLSVAALAAKSKSETLAGLFAFDCAALRSGRAERQPPIGEGVDECYVVRLRQLRVHPQHGGFTLLEVLVALSLLGILAAMLSLQFVPLLAQTQLHDATRQLVTNLQYVRMKAISQNRRLRVTFRPDTRDYIIERDEDGVWQRQLLHSHTEAEVPDAIIPLPRRVRIMTVNSGGDVIFLPRGAVDGGISITLGVSPGGETSRVVVNLAGRVRVE
jgi:prepilin-type N-terminal cleavage/methylation domain-containing protein